MRLATVKQSQEIDSLSQTVYKLSGEVLMESAGALSAREIDQSYYPELKSGLTAVVCGPGNNGGDGLVLARHLHSMGHREVAIFILSGKKKSQKKSQKNYQKNSHLFELQRERAELQGLRIVDLESEPEKLDLLNSAKVIVDAIFGIGLSKSVEDFYAQVIDRINATQVPIVSLDVPSGLHCDTGMVLNAAIRASMTISFGLNKPGFFVNLGPLHIGRLRTLSIGFPFEVIRGVATSHFGFTEKLARRYLPKRKETSNKSDHGRLVIYAGQEGMWGAGVLSASSAFRMGAGYVVLASFDDSSAVVTENPEVMTASVKDTMLSEKRPTAVAIGPGLGVNQNTADLIDWLKQEGHERVVVDADALTTCVQYDLFPLPESWIITPHAGELSRIIDWNSQEIEADRFKAASLAQECVGCHVLLKGFRSVLAYKGRSMVILSGNSALAKAGTGDVLTGMVAGLLAQKLPPLQATATAAYIHGRMADEWVRVGNDKRALTASDLRDHLPGLMGRLAGGALL